MHPLLQWRSSKYWSTYSECEFVALDIQHAIHMLWPVHLYNIFPRTNATVFEGGKKIEHKMCVSIFSTSFG